jgi:hypothetical protein
MVNELVSINSLQQLIEIQQDLSGGSTTAGSSGSSGSGANAAAAQTNAASPSPSYHDAVVQRNLFPAQAPASL